MLTVVLSIFPSHLHKTKATKVHGMKDLLVLALSKDLCMNHQTYEMATNNKKMGWHCKSTEICQPMIKENWETHEKKTGDCTKSMWNSIFPDQDLGRGGNKYLLKYYLALCMVQFCLLPSPLGNPGTSPALQAREWGIIEAVLSWGKGGGANKKYIFSLILQSTSYFLCGLNDGCGLQECIFLRKNAGIVREWLERNNLSKLKSVFKGMF